VVEASAGRAAASRRRPAGGSLPALGFLLTPVALGFLASAWYFPEAEPAFPAALAAERRGERRSIEAASHSTGSKLYNPANLCAAGGSCSKIERHDKRQARRILPLSPTSKQSTYGSGRYVGLRRN
jgi:hypothetical protein